MGTSPIWKDSIALTYCEEDQIRQFKAILANNGSSRVGVEQSIMELTAMGIKRVPALGTIQKYSRLLVRGVVAEDLPAEEIEPWEEPKPQRASAPVKAKQVPASRFQGKKILVLDIETIPAIVHTYDLRSQWTSPKNVLLPGQMLCFAAAFIGDPYRTRYFVDSTKGQERMLDVLWKLMDEADYIVGWNSNRFDLKKIQGYFVKYGYGLPSPAKSIDLMVAARGTYFESRSLDYTARMLGTERKVEGAGAAGWKEYLGLGDLSETDPDFAWRSAFAMTYPEKVEVTEGVAKARKDLKAYNLGDIEATEELFFRLAPLIKAISLFDDGCVFCGSQHYSHAGHHETPASRWEVVRCDDCSRLYRVGSAEKRNDTLMARPV